jgi:cytochrome P450
VRLSLRGANPAERVAPRAGVVPTADTSGGMAVRDGLRAELTKRVVLLYASANMDETQFDQPEVFSLQRKANHLGWGFGADACVGIYLSKMEMHALLHAMIPEVARISVAGPIPLLNNTLQGFESLRATFRR